MANRYRLFGMQELMINMTAGDDNCIINPGGLHINGELNFQKLEKSIQKLADESDAMRFVFHRDAESGRIYQSILDKYKYKLDVRDCIGSTYEEKHEFMTKDVQKVMKQVEYLLDDDVKWKCVLYRFSDEEYGLWFIINHLVSDGLSVSNAITRIVLRYNNIPLPPMAKYIDYIREQYKLEKDPECLQLRRDYVASVKDYRQPISSAGIGNTEGFYKEVSSLPTEGMKRFARSNKMSLFHASLFLYHAALSVTFGKHDTMIGVAVGVRKLKHMFSIGEYLSGFLDRLTFKDSDMMHDMAVKCKDQFLRESKRDYALYNSFRKGTLFTIAYQNFSEDEKKIIMGKASAKPYEDQEKYMKAFYWKGLCIDAYEMEERISYMAGVDETLFSPETMRKMKTAFEIGEKCLSGKDMTYSEYCTAVEEAFRQNS